MVRPSIFAALLLTTSLAGEPARAQAPDPGPDRVSTPYFAVDGAAASALLLKEMRVRFSVAGVIASVQLTQIYSNESAEPLEAVYVFPGSTRSAVHSMQMKIGERRIEAKIDRRDRARARYDEARDQGRTASLLEEQRPNVFQMKVANILAGDSVEVVLHYSELLVPSEETYELVVPTVVGPRYVGGGQSETWTANPHLHEGEAPPFRFSLSGTIDAGLPLAALQSPSHRISPRFRDASRVDVILEDGEAADRDFVLRYRLGGDGIQTGLLLYPGRDEGYFLMMVAPPARPAPVEILPREYVFIVDVSGSMSGFPLDTAKAVTRRLLAELKSQDRFNVLLFAGGSALFAPASVEATPENVDGAIAFIDSEQGGGGTELLPALERAYGLPSLEGVARSIVLITDGYVSVEKEAFELTHRKLGDGRLFPFGVGGSVNRFLVEGLARAGMGESFVALSAEEGEAQATRLVELARAPLLTDLRLESEGFEIFDLVPSAIPDLHAKRPVLVMGKYRGSPTGRLRLHGMGSSSSFEASVQVDRYEGSDDNSALETLWARHRIERLSDLEAIAPAPELEAEITMLGLRHSLLSRYTSFVAIDQLVRNTGGAPKTIRQVLPLPRGVGDSAVGGEGIMGKFGGAGVGAGGGGVLGVIGTGAGGAGYGVGGLGSIGHGRGVGGKAGPSARGAASTEAVFESTTVSGALAKDEITRVIRRNKARLQACYEKALVGDPKLSGKITVRFTIGTDGRVSAASIAASSLGAKAVEDCVTQSILGLVFPAPAGGGQVLVSYPFVFAPR